MSSAQFKLDMFEGPLDLLLHLISKHKLNIHDIEISLLLEQYMEYIHQLDHEDLEDAADFLEMAARLIYIKTVSLLPQDEEAQELKKELEGRLIEYSQCKYLANILSRAYAGGEIFVRKPVVIPVDKTYTREHDPMILLEAYLGLSEKARNEKPINAKLFQPIVSYKVVSVGSKIIYILKKLYTVGVCDLSHIYDGMETKSERVATFLAILELTKSGKICLNEDNTQISFSDRSRERKKHNTDNKPQQNSEITDDAPKSAEQADASKPTDEKLQPVPENETKAEITGPVVDPVMIVEQEPAQTENTLILTENEQDNDSTADLIVIQSAPEPEPSTAVEQTLNPAPQDELPEFEPDDNVYMPKEREASAYRPKQSKPIAERVSFNSESIFAQPAEMQTQPVTEPELPQQEDLTEQTEEGSQIPQFTGQSDDDSIKADIAFKPSYWNRLRYYWGNSPVGDDRCCNYWRYGISQL